MTALRVDKMLGLELLYGLLSEGLDLQTYEAQFFRENAGPKKASKTTKCTCIEAETLSRLIQVTLLDYDCPILVVENHLG